MIAIDGMNVPNRCLECKFSIYYHCIVKGRDIEIRLERPDWCPIHEVKHFRKVIVIRKEYNDIGLEHAKKFAEREFADAIGETMNCKKCEHLDENYQPMDDLIEYRFDMHVVDMRSKASPTCCQPEKQSGVSVEDMT